MTKRLAAFALLLLGVTSCKPLTPAATTQAQPVQSAPQQELVAPPLRKVAVEPEQKPAPQVVQTPASLETTAQVIARVSGLAPNDSGVARELTLFAEMCEDSETRVGDMLAAATKIVNERHPEVTIAKMLQEAVKTQPLAGGPCADTLGMLAASIRAVP